MTYDARLAYHPPAAVAAAYAQGMRDVAEKHLSYANALGMSDDQRSRMVGSHQAALAAARRFKRRQIRSEAA